MVTIYVAGFQTVAIFMQTGVAENSVAAVDRISDAVMDSPHKVCAFLIAEYNLLISEGMDDCKQLDHSRNLKSGNNYIHRRHYMTCICKS